MTPTKTPTTTPTTPAAALTGAWGRFWFPAWPRSRVAALRTLVYGFVVLDVLVVRPWVADHGDVPTALYRPLLVGRVLPLPVPTPFVVEIVRTGLLAGAAVAITGRLPRLAGAVVFGLYLEWMVIAFSYGKVDHDRVAFLIALAVIPTVGRVGWRDHVADARAGWALRFVQVGVVATYFLAAFAKLRYGGLAWLDSATLLRAVVRRGTDLGDRLADHPDVLHAAQYGLVAFELAAPLLLVGGRVGRAMLVAAVAFHAVTYATIGIAFHPHVVCLVGAFVAWERLVPGQPGRTPEPQTEPAPGG